MKVAWHLCCRWFGLEILLAKHKTEECIIQNINNRDMYSAGCTGCSISPNIFQKSGLMFDGSYTSRACIGVHKWHQCHIGTRLAYKYGRNFHWLKLIFAFWQPLSNIDPDLWNTLYEVKLTKILKKKKHVIIQWLSDYVLYMQIGIITTLFMLGWWLVWQTKRWNKCVNTKLNNICVWWTFMCFVYCSRCEIMHQQSWSDQFKILTVTRWGHDCVSNSD